MFEQSHVNDHIKKQKEKELQAEMGKKVAFS
jgi:hypothetical protein